jgi:hypothetical protein
MASLGARHSSTTGTYEPSQQSFQLRSSSFGILIEGNGSGNEAEIPLVPTPALTPRLGTDAPTPPVPAEIGALGDGRPTDEPGGCEPLLADALT